MVFYSKSKKNLKKCLFVCIPILDPARDYSQWWLPCGNTHKDWFGENFEIRTKGHSSSSCMCHYKYARYGKPIHDALQTCFRISLGLFILVATIDICYFWI